jgi:hypothetical protein
MRNVNKLWVFIVILSVFSCNSDNEDKNALGCAEDLICTEQAETFGTSIKDQDQEPVSLTSFQVINTENGEDLIDFNSSFLGTSTYEDYQRMGWYPMISYGAILPGQFIELEFKGFIDDQEVISSNYVFTADCCNHINLVSGDLDLILE